MAQFPFKEADIVALADSVLAGLTGHTAIYPDPPVDSADFRAAIARNEPFRTSKLTLHSTGTRA